jgi:GNAT superfamily N-acetyltransferase
VSGPRESNFTIAPLVVDDIDALCSLAREIWREHYPPIIGMAQTEYMLAQRYLPELIGEELAHDDIWWDVLTVDGQLAAFASSFRTEGDRALKLDKLYVHRSHQGKGYGRALIEHTCERAARLAYASVVLAVNKRNASAISAYTNCGFAIVEAVVKDIGGGFVMDDYVMRRSIARQAVGERREARTDAA